MRATMCCIFLLVLPYAAAMRQPMASSAEVTPMSKVITLIEDLKTQVEAEGTDEAAVYDKFACFCQKTTMDKSKAITEGKDSIDSESASIESKTAEKGTTETELKKRKAKQEELAQELKASQVRCAKEKAAYELNDADLTKAIGGLNGAIDALTKAKPASLLAIKDQVESSMVLATALGLIEKPRQVAVSGFLQGELKMLMSTKVDPSDPEYKYHSDGILDVIQKLLTEYDAKKADADAEWAKTDKACKETEASLTAEMTANADAIKAAKSRILELKQEIAEHRTNLLEDEAQLKDDQAYLEDLTSRCEARANDWDQRSKLRSGEVEALTEALKILKDRAQPMAEDVNKRALLLSRSSTVTESSEPVSFVQRAQVSSALAAAKQGRAADLLRSEGLRLKSSVLSSLAGRVGADPFKKVIKLIQDLVERLIKEATQEATKKGFCDTELGKARKDRDYRLADVKKLNLKLAGLELKKDELEAELDELAAALTKLNEALVTATSDRKAEKKTNMKTLKDAKEGLVALDEALKILRQFYKVAAKATVFAQASPVDEDTEGAGFSGAYKGNQKQSTGIIGMLEVIQSDFKRTLRTTEASEKESAAAFVIFDRTSKTDIAGKETKTELDQEDLKTTKAAIAQGMEDLNTNMDLLDKALETIEDLKPTCIDTTMSYSERVAKREAEIAALNKALCILDTDGVEADCAP